MKADKKTKGAVRYSDGGTPYAKNIYLRNEEVEKLGSPANILITITAMK